MRQEEKRWRTSQASYMLIDSGFFGLSSTGASAEHDAAALTRVSSCGKGGDTWRTLGSTVTVFSHVFIFFAILERV